MTETITTNDVLNRLARKVQAVKNAIETKDMNKLREECACSLICGDENILFDLPVLDEHLSFKYKGFDCELGSCNAIININQLVGCEDKAAVRKRFPGGVFSDRYVCWIWGTRDIEGHTLAEYLELNPSETEEHNYWAPEVYLVPKAWAWGAESDLKPGETVEKLILTGIDEFLNENPNI